MFDTNDTVVEPTLTPEELEADASLDEVKDIDPANASPEQVAALIKSTKTLNAQRSHWKGKATTPVAPKVEQVIASVRTAAQAPKLEETVAELQLSEEKRKFAHANNLSPEETDSVYSFAKGNGVKPADALKHTFVKSGIEAMRRDSANANATPGASGRAPLVEGKSFGQMKPDERRKNFEAVVAASQKK